MPDFKDQYLKALDYFDSENSRFWTRFNTFTGLQMVVIAGMAANYNEIMKNQVISLLILTAAFVFSIFTVFAIWRSRQIELAVLSVIIELEDEDQSNTLVLMKKYLEKSKSPMGTIDGYCMAISVFLSLFWLTFFLHTLLSQM